MTREDKELLLKDLSARLFYHPLIYGKTGYATNEGRLTSVFSSGIHIMTAGGTVVHYYVEEVKPYLRPMSSMTKKEQNEYDLFFSYGEHGWDEYTIEKEVPSIVDWLNAHHFDYRGLIEKGLALEATEGMYREG